MRFGLKVAALLAVASFSITQAHAMPRGATGQVGHEDLVTVCEVLEFVTELPCEEAARIGFAPPDDPADWATKYLLDNTGGLMSAGVIVDVADSTEDLGMDVGVGIDDNGGLSTETPGSVTAQGGTNRKLVHSRTCGKTLEGYGYFVGRTTLYKPTKVVSTGHKWREIAQINTGVPDGRDIHYVGHSIWGTYEGRTGDLFQYDKPGMTEVESTQSWTVSVLYNGFGGSATWNAAPGHVGGYPNSAYSGHTAGWYREDGSSSAKSSVSETLWKIEKGTPSSWSFKCGVAFW